MRTDVSFSLPTPGNARAEVLADRLKNEARDRQRLREAAGEFESLLLEQMVKDMRASVPKSKLFGDDPGRELFNEMLDGEFVRLMSNRGGVGLADFLVQNLNDPHFRK
jgi:flagellar protein FlgJ